jgi:AcrR family transcriptional regulator
MAAATARTGAKRRTRQTRRTNVERSAATRERLIKAAIHCLHKYGYAATSTTLIADTAEVSRGAMLHQFPNKVDLTLAVAEYVINAQRQFYTDELFKLERGRERYVAITRLTWEAWSQPSGIAVIEIMVAARSDPVLSERFPPLARALVRSQRDDIWAIAKSAGITDRDEVDASAQLNLATIRGLCVDLMFTPEPEPIEKAMHLLMKYKNYTADDLIARGAGIDLVLMPRTATSAGEPEDAQLLTELTQTTDALKRKLADAILAEPALRELMQRERPRAADSKKTKTRG